MARLLLVSTLLMALAAVATPRRSVAAGDPQTAADGNAFEPEESPSSIAIVDLNRDKRPELVVTNRHTNAVSILLNHGNGSLTKAGMRPASRLRRLCPVISTKMPNQIL
jgi:hypothetical protein